jgi:pyochelin biosynthetic protein PchC
MTAAAGPAARWLRPLRTSPTADVRLVCFPHAGGAASVYRRWLPHLPDAYELWAVQYPGREDRVGEPHPSGLGELSRQIAFALQWAADKPYVLFGHSMGAVVAYETCRHLALLGLPEPRRLIVSGSPPPAEAADACRAEADAPPQWLDTPDLTTTETATLATRTLTADLALLTDYRPTPGPPLSVPLTSVRGTDDHDLSPDTDRGWHSVTDNTAETRLLAGGHFGCFTDPRTAVRDIAYAVP